MERTQASSLKPQASRKRKPAKKPRGGAAIRVVEGDDPTDRADPSDRSDLPALNPLGGVGRLIPLEAIEDSPHQARENLGTAEEMEELVETLKRCGQLQPVVVRPLEQSTPTAKQRYELIAGHRRLLAAARAGWTQIAAVVRDCSPAAAAELTLIENECRKDLNPIERAKALKLFMEAGGLKQAEAAKRLKLSPGELSNRLRLLKLSPAVQAVVVKGQMSARHARAIAAMPSLLQATAYEAWCRDTSVPADKFDDYCRALQGKEKKPLSPDPSPQGRGERNTQASSDQRSTAGARPQASRQPEPWDPDYVMESECATVKDPHAAGGEADRSAPRASSLKPQASSDQRSTAGARPQASLDREQQTEADRELEFQEELQRLETRICDIHRHYCHADGHKLDQLIDALESLAAEFRAAAKQAKRKK